MPERITIDVVASGEHPDVLTIQDAMQQVLDFFNMLQDPPGVEWKLEKATTNTPLHVEAVAVSFAPSVDVSVVARQVKEHLARNLDALTSGKPPIDADFPIAAARRFLNRSLNGVGKTYIDLELGKPFTITPTIARVAVRAIERKVSNIFDIPRAKSEIGSVEGTLKEVGTYYNHPAVMITTAVGGVDVWCRLEEDLQVIFQDKTTYADIWKHRRVMVRGQLNYADDGRLNVVDATDIRRLEPREVSLSELRDPRFTGGLSVTEYLDQFRDGLIGGKA